MSLIKLLVIYTVLCVYSASGFNLTILHTNDVHARIQQANKYGGSCSVDDATAGKCYGGVARRFSKVQEIRNINGGNNNVLLMDAGDGFQGTLWFYVYQGLAAAYFNSWIGYDVASLGNHEFDDGPEILGRFLQNITYPVVTCNLDASNEPLLNGLFNKSVVLNVGGEQIGVVGYLTPETKTLVQSGHVVNLVFNDEIECLTNEVNILKAQGINKIIALGHSGFSKDVEIATMVDGIDIVVGGHTNTFLYTGKPPSNEEPIGEYPVIVTQASGKKAYVVEGYAHGKYLGHLEVTFNQDGDITSATGNPLLLDGSIPEDTAVLSAVNEWAAPLQIIMNTDVGQSFVYLEGDRSVCRVRECNLGNLVADAVLYSTLLHIPEKGAAWTNAAIAVWNAGGIRSSLDQGPIRLGTLMEVLPFRNEVFGLDLEGRYVLAMLENSVSGLDDAAGRFLQISGLKVWYDLDKDIGSRVHKVQVRCANCSIPVYEDLDENVMYGMITSFFLLGGGDGYDILRDHAKNVLPYGFTALDATRSFIERHEPIAHGEEGRIYFLTEEDRPSAIPPLPSSAQNLKNIGSTILSLSLCFIIPKII